MRIAVPASRTLGQPGVTLGALEHRLLAAHAALDAALDAGTPTHEAIASTAETHAHTLRFDADALPRPRFVRAAAADGPLDPAALRQARLGATQAFAAGHITRAAWREELARVRAHKGAAAEAADGPVERPNGDAGAGAPKAPGKPAEVTPRAGATTATDPNLAIGVAAVAHRNTPPAPLPDDDDAAAAYVAAAHARTEQIDTVEAIGTVVDALPAEAREGLAAIVEEARAATPESIAPDGTGETQLAQAPFVVPPPAIPGATPFGAAPVPVLTPDELDRMGREIEEAVRAAAPHMRPGALGAAGISLRVLGDLLGVIDPLPADQTDDDREGDLQKKSSSSGNTPPAGMEPEPNTPNLPIQAQSKDSSADDSTSAIPSVDPTKLSIEDLSRAAAAPDRNQLTGAGGALQKHSSRPGSAYSAGGTKARDLNRLGQEVVDGILRDPKSTWRKNRVGGLDVIAPDGKAIRFNPDGPFSGLREPTNR